MVKTEEVVAFVDRITGVWRTRNDAYKEETRRMVFRASKPDWEPHDLNAAFDALLAVHPVTAKDGGPAMPPNPGEILGLILSAKRNRIAAGDRTHIPVGTRTLRNRPCPICSGPRMLVPGGAITFIYCQSPCNRSWLHSDIDGEPLEFADPPPISKEEIDRIKIRYSIGQGAGKD